MQSPSLILQVWDLLRNVGRQDELVLEDIQIPALSMCDQGVSLVCEMTAINEYTVYVRLIDIVTQMTSVCDLCAKSYTQDIVIENYDVRFAIPVEQHKSKQARPTEEDCDFMIDAKMETIDLAEAIYQAITMSVPIISYCPDCQQKEIDVADEYDLYA